MDTARDEKVGMHPQLAMKSLGITYKDSTPMSIVDCWIFWVCENVPKELPKYLEVINIDPKEMIGHGLNEQMANRIQELEDEINN